MSDREVKKNVVLVLEHFQGPFIVFFVGIGTASIAFFAEILSNRKIQ